MISYSGRRVFPETSEAPSIEDIGVGLGSSIRFRGHTALSYTVLSHSLAVANIMPLELGIHGLLHDAAEAVVGDIPRPWKTQADSDRENEIMSRVYAEHNLSWPLADDIEAEVRKADNAMLAAEAHVLAHPAADELWPNPDQEAMQIVQDFLPYQERCRIPELAKAIFQVAFDEHMMFAGMGVGTSD